MEDLRERAAQRLIEPGAIVECMRNAVAAFDDSGLSLTDSERLARMVRERCDHADEVRLAKSARLWDWAGDHVPPAAVDADLLEDHAYEYREALATGDLTVGLQAVSDYAATLGLPDPSPLTRRMMARVILREMAASCERTAARYRREVVPYLDPPHPYQDTFDELEELDRSSEPFPSNRDVIEWTSSAPLRRESEDDEECSGQDVTERAPALGEVPTRDVGVAHSPTTELDRSGDDCHPLHAEIPTIEAALPREDGLDPSKAVRELWDQFAHDMKRPKGTWTEDNARHSKAFANLWERLHPNLPVAAIQSRHAQELQRIALELPSLHAKARVWATRPIREVATIFAQLPRDPDDDGEIDGVKELVDTLEAANAGRPIDRQILSLAAWNRMASCARFFGTWLVKNGLHEQGEAIFGDLHVDVDEDAEEKRRGRRPGRLLWTRPQAEALFETPLFVGSQSPYRRYKPGDWLIGDALYWIVPIAATTGMRREEIAQVRVRHVRKYQPADGAPEIWYFDLRAKGLKLKNQESRRDVPVPDALIQLGLVETLVNGREPDEMLLGNVTRNAEGRYGDIVGKSFGRYRAALPEQNVGSGDDAEVVDFGAPLLDLHAFRHSVATWLIDADVHQAVAEELLGHRSPERRTAFMGYDHGRRLEKLKAAIDAMPAPFDPVRLRALRMKQCRPRVKVKANRRRQSSRMIEQTA